MGEIIRGDDVVDGFLKGGAYRSLLDAIRIPAAALSEDMTLLFCNNAYAETLDAAAADLEGKNLLALYPEFARTESFEIYQRVLSTGVSHSAEAWCGERYLHSRVFAAPWGLVAIAEDVTERKLVEAALEKANRNLEQERKIFIDGPVVVFKCRNAESWPVDYVSPNVEKILGYPAGDFVSGKLSYSDVIAGDDVERFSIRSRQATESGVDCFEQQPYRLMKKDGEPLWVDDHTTVVRNAHGAVTHYLGYIVDITARVTAENERRVMEEQLQQLQKLDSLGVLAGGIAHDFNNLLMGILGNADLALLDLPASSTVRKNVLAIKEASQRASKVANQMLSYSGRERLERKRVDLNEMVSEVDHLLKASLSRSVVLKYDLSAQIPAVEVDATKVSQILLNLVLNAAEAIGERSGIVVIRTSVTECDDAIRARAFLKENLTHKSCVCLEVTDTGCGMSEETLSKIFDPFFSTKFTGRGLGLATLFGIVRSHHGAISVESRPGHGTTFKVLLPPSDDQTPVATMENRTPGREWNGSGTVLLVDDDNTIRVVATEMLNKFGYSVLTAADGREAVTVFEQNADVIDLVLLDFSMPHMDGKQACAAIREIRRDVPVIISSGYGDEVLGTFQDLNVAGFLKKPFTSVGLFDKVLAALGVPED